MPRKELPLGKDGTVRMSNMFLKEHPKNKDGEYLL